MTEDGSQAAAEDLAKRLRLLMDVAVAESGSEPTYSQIADYLKERGTNLSRSRWIKKPGALTMAPGAC